MFYRVIAGFIVVCTLSACGDSGESKDQRELIPDTLLVTFSEHIAPLVWENCAPCHRPGEAGPFSLLEYADLKKRTKMIRHVTESGFMPPWPADPGYRSFVGERRLSDYQKALIARWVEQGAEKGDPNLLPEMPDFSAQRPLGEPDAIVYLKDTVWIPGNNSDLFLYIKVPFELERDTFLRAIEFVPGNRQLLHHMNGNLINYAPGQKTDHFAGATIVDPDTTGTFTAYQYMQLANDDGSYPVLTPSAVNYLPGVEAAFYPEGIGGFRISKQGAFLVQTMHYGPSAIDTFDLSYFKLYFVPEPPKRPLREIQMGTLGETPVIPDLVIPADSVVSFYTEYRVKQDLSLLTINPHMHLLGTRFKAYAIPPQGDTIPLVHIPEWDFRWQYFYTFEKMLKIPKGSIIRAEATFDNTTDNPHQPFSPLRDVVPPEEGDDMKTTDEMFQFFINYVPYEEGDEEVSLEP